MAHDGPRCISFFIISRTDLQQRDREFIRRPEMPRGTANRVRKRWIYRREGDSIGGQVSHVQGVQRCWMFWWNVLWCFSMVWMCLDCLGMLGADGLHANPCGDIITPRLMVV
jgi:hypothetical protein